ncbi:tail tape measure protein core region-containing protein [Burkholderia sp. lig30]|jgi:hypothetical protein|uniref:phage tail tape measure protein n=1 Tax=Burkholderia sp. lig30 TaxID=1192124 RepID=UPI0004616B66|nr:phage tail tape measure protein [Burkholderia sp. lig30]KDB09517.1 tail tape measure protein core region-containing protein [Burkholderia sp. lig30]
MSRDLEVGLTAKWHDEASGPAQQTGRNVQRSVEQTEAAAVRADHGTLVSAERTAQARVQASVRADEMIRTSAQRSSEARAQLSARSDQAIRREIDQNVAAYNRLARAGFASVNEQARAYGALAQRVGALNRELRNTEQIEGRMARSGRAVGAMWQAGGAIAAGAAGVMVAAPAVRETMGYDRRIAMMANTAFSDRDVAGRRAGMVELNNAIVGAVRYGGGSREQAADTLDNLLASGAISQKSAINMLPTLQKFATATGADPNELGNIAIRAMQNFGIKESEIPRALDMALKAGQAGGFELKDMAKWLPQQMAIAKTAGMSGLKDFSSLLVANQASVITSGTKDEAGNNLVNLLEKLNSSDTQHKAKTLGIDLTGSLSASRAQGVNPLDAFVGIVERVIAKDSRYQKLQAQLAKAPEGERRDILASQADLLQGSAIGKLIHDRQALGALVAYMNQADYRKQVVAQVNDSRSAVDGNFSLISGTASFKTQQLDNEKTFAQQDALQGVDSKLGDVASKLTEYAQKYPGITTAMVGATDGLKVFTAALTAAASVSILRDGFRGGGAAAAAAEGAADAAALAKAGALGADASRGSRLLAGAKWAGRLAAPLTVLAGGLEAMSVANDSSLSAEQKKAAYVGVGGGVAGALAGGAAGAAVGSVVPGVGTALGFIGGAAGGYFGHDWGEKIGKMIGDAIFAQKKDEKPAPIEAHLVFNLDGIPFFETIQTMNRKAALRQ